MRAPRLSAHFSIQGNFSPLQALCKRRDVLTQRPLPQPYGRVAGSRAHSSEFGWTYKELAPDVFGEELLTPGYQDVERIAVVALVVTRIGAGIGGNIDEQASEIRY